MTGGDSIGGRAEELRSVAGAVPSGLAAEVAEAAEQIRDQLADIIGDGSVEVVGLAQHQVEEANGLFRTLVALREALHSVSGYHSGVAPAGGSGVGGSGSRRSDPGSAPATPSPVTGPDGSQYPAAAGWAADIMPPRVRRGQPQQRTIGYTDGQLEQFTSGNDQTWSPYVQERLREHGTPLDVARRLKSHVELKVAARMVQRGQTHSDLVINHVPCGSEQGDAGGCHDTLRSFLPEGTTLTVHGTTQQGNPYSHTYRGTA